MRNTIFEEDRLLAKAVGTPSENKPRFDWAEALGDNRFEIPKVRITDGAGDRDFHIAEVAEVIGEALTNLMISREENEIYTPKNRELVVESARIVADRLKITATIAGIQHGHHAAIILQNNLCRIAVIATVILPFAGLQLALNIDFRAFFQILLGDAAKSLGKQDNTMPFGLFAAFARVFITPVFAGCQTQIHHRTPVFGAPDIGVCAKISHQNDLIHASCHDSSPCYCARVSDHASFT